MDDPCACVDRDGLMSAAHRTWIDDAAQRIERPKAPFGKVEIGVARCNCGVIHLLMDQSQKCRALQKILRHLCHWSRRWPRYHRTAWVKKVDPALLFQRAIAGDGPQREPRPDRIMRDGPRDPPCVMKTPERAVVAGRVIRLIRPDQDDIATCLRQMIRTGRTHQPASDNGEISAFHPGPFAW